MKPWIIEPVWQNYSSMYREAITARDAATGMELSHHLTASLYFAISTLEAFLNHQMREHMKPNYSEEEIFKVLYDGFFKNKVKEWPKKILGKSLVLRKETIKTILFFNNIRGNLTHVKTNGQEIYRTLQTVDPNSVVNVVAEYIAQFCFAKGEQFHYWLFGWNYLNPSSDEYEIILMPSSQFVHSMAGLGFKINSYDSSEQQNFKDKYLSDYDGYRALSESLAMLDSCEPKFVEFPYQPKLCRYWWRKDHHRTCGHVTREAIDQAIARDNAYAKQK